MSTTLSVLGLYNWDNTLFDNMVIPEHLDKQVLIDNLLLETAELEVVYPNFDMLKFAIGVWSKKEKLTWDKLYETLVKEYDFTQNYDRKEEITDTETRDLRRTGTEIRDLDTLNSEQKTDKVSDVDALIN